MNIIQLPLKLIDRWQQKHPVVGFPYAVIKKYGEDQGGYQAVLLTYYGFLAIFPLLLILTTVTQLFLRGNPDLRERISQSINSYIPVIGNQLQGSVHNYRGTGFALVIGLLILLYGARGIADAFRNTVNALWGVPLTKRSGFLPAIGRSFGIVGLGGLGFITSAVVASYATVAGHSFILRLPFIFASMAVLFLSFMLIIKLGLNRSVSFAQIRVGAAITAVGLVILQSLGGYLITNQLRHLDDLYSTFAVALGLLFWLYLQTQLVVYAMEVDIVRSLKLWPRSLLEEDKALNPVSLANAHHLLELEAESKKSKRHARRLRSKNKEKKRHGK